jgi:integrase
MAEWLKAHAWKACIRETVSWVRIPLPPPDIVDDGQDAGGAFVFPGGKRGQPLSNMAFLMLLRRMKRADLTAHGFRSSFRDWAAERTNFPNEVAEMALAHTLSSKVEAAYRRGDLFERRRRMMTVWADFCGTTKMIAPSNDARAAYDRFTA